MNIGNYYFLYDKNFKKALECYEIVASVLVHHGKNKTKRYITYLNSKDQVLFAMGRL